MTIYDKTTLCDIAKSGDENDFNRLITRIRENDVTVTTLDIQSRLTEQQIKQLFSALQSNTTVRELTLRAFSFEQPDDLSNSLIQQSLATLLKKNTALQTLTLFHTGIDDNGAIQLAAALKENESLEHLKISGHNMDSLGFIALIDMLSHHQNLKSCALYYGQNSIHPYLSFFLATKLPDFSPALALDIPFIGLQPMITEHFLSEGFENKHLMPIREAIDKEKKMIEQFIRLLKILHIEESTINTLKNHLEKDNKKKEALAQQYAELMLKSKEKPETIKQKKQELCEEYNQLVDNTDQAVKKLIAAHKDRGSKLLRFSEKLAQQPPLNPEAPLTPLQPLPKIDDLPEIEPQLTPLKPLPKIDDLPEIEPQLTPLKPLPNIDDLPEIEPSHSPVPETLTIEKTSTADYLKTWTEAVIANQYNYVILSIGSAGVQSQQIPAFSKGLNRVAILNIDPSFTPEEQTTKRTSTNMSLNYLKDKIDAQDNSSQIKEDSPHYAPYLENLKNRQASMAAFKTSIKQLTNAGVNVILLNHIAPLASAYAMKSVLEENKEQYGENFLFINSYFTDTPTLICSKAFLEQCLSDQHPIYKVLGESSLNNPEEYKKFGSLFQRLDYIKSSDITSSFKAIEKPRPYTSPRPK